MITRNRCVHCRRFYRPNPRVKEQRYCRRKGCQRARKSRWQREKMSRDPDYKANHKRAQSDWAARNPDYWCKYRQSHPQYTEQNRDKQRERDRERRKRDLAKKDASEGKNHIETGTYYLVPTVPENLAKVDVSGQKVRIISEGFLRPGSNLAKKDATDTRRWPVLE